MLAVDYDTAVEDFLKETGTTMDIEYVETVYGFPFDEKDTYPHKQYNVTLKRNGKEYSFPYYGSYYDYKNNRFPTKHEILGACELYDVGSMKDFVEEFGYEIYDRKSFERVENIWLNCKYQYEKLLELFGEGLLEKLAEIV